MELERHSQTSYWHVAIAITSMSIHRLALNNAQYDNLIKQYIKILDVYVSGCV